MGQLLHGIIDPIFNPIKTIKKIINKADELSWKVTLCDIINTVDTSKIILNAFQYTSKKTFAAGITLKNTEIKDYESN